MKKALKYLILLFFIHCYADYRVPYYALIMDTSYSGRGENNMFYPTREDQNANLIGTGKIIRSGKSCSISIAYIDSYIFIKGGSVQEAAQSANIDKIGSIEYSFFSILGFYSKECVIVWGEEYKEKNRPENRAEN